MAHKQFIQHSEIEEGISVLGVDPDIHNVNFVLMGKHPGVDRPQVMSYNMKVENKYKGMEAVSRFLGRMHQLSNIDVNNCAAFIETQDVRYTGKTNAANPQDLITLATMAGAISGLLGHHRVHSVHFVMPSKWKGQVPKDVSHARICKALGWNYDVNVTPKGKKQIIPRLEVVKNDSGDDIIGLYGSGNTGAYYGAATLTEKDVTTRLPNKGEWMDIMDSIGLALYGTGLIREEAKKAEIRKSQEEEKKKEK